MKKINRLEQIYAEFIKLCEPNGSGISFSDLYMQDHLGWDTYIKYFFFIQGLNRNLFVLTAFESKRINSNNNKYLNKNKLQSIYQLVEGKWKKQQKIENLSYGMDKKPSELMLDFSWYDIETHKMILGIELEQSRKREDTRLKDILFDFYKLLYINSELKILVSFPWQHQVDNLIKTMKDIVSKVSDDDNYYLIINMSGDKNRGYVRNRKNIDFEISGFILWCRGQVLRWVKVAIHW